MPSKPKTIQFGQLAQTVWSQNLRNKFPAKVRTESGSDLFNPANTESLPLLVLISEGGI
jgi:hypothetical protein